METPNHTSQWSVTTGIVLRTYPLTETSLIVRWITPDFGRISTVAKGARRPKSNFFGKLDLFFLANMSFRPSRSSELHTLREVTVCDTHSFLRIDLVRLELAAKAAALLEKHTETGTPLPGFYILLRDYLTSLKNDAGFIPCATAFKVKFLMERMFLLRVWWRNWVKLFILNALVGGFEASV